METQIKSENERTRVLFLSWSLEKDGCQVDTAFIWRGNELRIRVFSSTYPTHVSVHYELYFNKLLYGALHTTSTNDNDTEINLRDIHFKPYKLVFKSFAASLEIHEELVTPGDIDTRAYDSYPNHKPSATDNLIEAQPNTETDKQPYPEALAKKKAKDIIQLFLESPYKNDRVGQVFISFSPRNPKMK